MCLEYDVLGRVSDGGGPPDGTSVEETDNENIVSDRGVNSRQGLTFVVPPTLTQTSRGLEGLGP